MQLIPEPSIKAHILSLGESPCTLHILHTKLTTYIRMLSSLHVCLVQTLCTYKFGHVEADLYGSVESGCTVHIAQRQIYGVHLLIVALYNGSLFGAPKSKSQKDPLGTKQTDTHNTIKQIWGKVHTSACTSGNRFSGRKDHLCLVTEKPVRSKSKCWSTYLTILQHKSVCMRCINVNCSHCVSMCE